MNIGSLKLKGKTVLAPLAGITNLPFRLMVKGCGCSLVCSEMVSAKGLFYGSQKTFALINTHPLERPVSIQIFGSDPLSMSMAAGTIEKHGVADIIDINMGCSVKKVLKTGSGAALMQDGQKARAVIAAVRESTSLPVTIKIRSGWDSSGSQALGIATAAQKAGVDAVAIHPRTATQGFRGRGDWSIIAKLKENLSIPVIGNGDIVTAADGLRMMEETGCDAVMAGRGVMVNPFMLADIDDIVAGKPLEQRSRDDIFSVMKGLITASVEYFGEEIACRIMRSRIAFFVKGWPESSKFRSAISQITSMEQALEIIKSYQDSLHRQSITPTALRDLGAFLNKM
ncbi:MAG: tRNA dihydrouridine synthase DusB [Desulfamplus sp.]|nr:tRNA dihydrouridine synthase DusB [Desulfamplus sp.]